MHMALGVMAGIGARKPKIVRRRFAKHPEPVWNCKNKKSRVMRHSEGDGVAVGRGGHISTREGASHGQPRHTWARKEKTKEKGRQAEGRASETSSCVQTSAAGRATATQSRIRDEFVAQYLQLRTSFKAVCGNSRNAVILSPPRRAKNLSEAFVLNQQGFFASPRREASVRALRMTTRGLFPQNVEPDPSSR
jgi:hypothetical protein